VKADLQLIALGVIKTLHTNIQTKKMKTDDPLTSGTNGLSGKEVQYRQTKRHDDSERNYKHRIR